jgi:hypothetical protein
MQTVRATHERLAGHTHRHATPILLFLPHIEPAMDASDAAHEARERHSHGHDQHLHEMSVKNEEHA